MTNQMYLKVENLTIQQAAYHAFIRKCRNLCSITASTVSSLLPERTKGQPSNM